MLNPLNCIDFYKADHRRQYPSGTELVVSNFTPRSGKHANVDNKSEIIFFGLQYFMQEFLIDTWDSGFFEQPKNEVVAAYKRRMDTSLGVDAVPVEHIEALHDLGYLPIEIKALPEGTIVPVGVPCLTIHNTHKDFFWLTNYLETVLSTYLWQACTSATTAWNYRKLIDEYTEKTGSPTWFSAWQCHDFSFRGMGSLQSALLSGAAHLLFFKGTDTVPAIDLLEQYYEADADKEMIGGSVPATEHSVMCMGTQEAEIDTFNRLITEVYPKGIVSIVSDTWDFWKVLTEYAPALKDKIMAREGKVVFRPDSGDPVRILVGQSIPEYETIEEKYTKTVKVDGKYYNLIYNIIYNNHVDTIPVDLHCEQKGAVEVLWDIFGGTITDKGYKLLDPHVGLIYGDSITYNRAKAILAGLEAKGFASANVVFGVGSYTYQYVTRDTWGFAVKATYGEVNGEPRNIFKCPKTDDGGKKSAKGLTIVAKDENGKLCLWDEADKELFMTNNMLQTVFKDGEIVKHTSLAEIRKMHEV